MPIYLYRCGQCEHTIEVMQKVSDDPIETCEVCGGSVNKVINPVGLIFKGSGFYSTDYAQRGGNGEAKPAADKKPACADNCGNAAACPAN